MAGVEAVCFGDFHLGQQMKVTPPPGGTPGIGRERDAIVIPTTHLSSHSTTAYLINPASR